MSPARRLNNNLVKTIFFGNYFYGICAVALSIEASLQQEFPLNSLVYYALVFCGAVFYYTVAYLGEPSPNVGNERTRWYAANMQRIKRRQWVLGALILILAVLFAKDIWWQFLWAPAFYWFMVFVFPVVAALYYGHQYEKRWVESQTRGMAEAIYHRIYLGRGGNGVSGAVL